MSTPEKELKKGYTYGDYLKWDEDERWEIVEGEAYNMSPSPSRLHQAILRELLYQFTAYLHDKTCEVYSAPFDVRLPKEQESEEDIDTVVQPDIVVVCNPAKLDDRGCKGAPDLVIEIVSPHTIKKDLKIKLGLYEKAGVKEYWIVYPEDGVVMVFKMGDDNKYGRPYVYGDEDSVRVGIFDDLVVDLKQVFKKE